MRRIDLITNIAKTSCFCRKENAANCIHLIYCFELGRHRREQWARVRDAILNHPSHMISQKSGLSGRHRRENWAREGTPSWIIHRTWSRRSLALTPGILSGQHRYPNRCLVQISVAIHSLHSFATNIEYGEIVMEFLSSSLIHFDCNLRQIDYGLHTTTYNKCCSPTKHFSGRRSKLGTGSDSC